MSDTDSSTSEVNHTEQQHHCHPGGFPLSRCKHNHFDNTRVKKGRVSLRCRDCGVKWRAPHPLKNLCSEFYETRGLCSLGSSCPYLHVHRFKCTMRSPQHPEYVGEDRDDLLRDCAIAVFTSLQPRRPLPRSVMPEIMELYRLRKQSSPNDPLEHSNVPPVYLMIPPAATAEQDLPNRTMQGMAEGKTMTPSKLEQIANAPQTSVVETHLPMGAQSPPSVPVPSTSAITRPLLPITGRYVPTQRTFFHSVGDKENV